MISGPDIGARPPCPVSANASPTHSCGPTFEEFAGLEGAFGPWEPGVCFHAPCSRRFAPKRDWQRFCSAACRRAAQSELRKWGDRMALALLTERMGRYAPKGSTEKLLAAEARRYIGLLQTAWIQERREAREAAQSGGRNG